jgi:hypothetical protein
MIQMAGRSLLLAALFTVGVLFGAQETAAQVAPKPAS